MCFVHQKEEISDETGDISDRLQRLFPPSLTKTTTDMDCDIPLSDVEGNTPKQSPTPAQNKDICDASELTQP